MKRKGRGKRGRWVRWWLVVEWKPEVGRLASPVESFSRREHVDVYQTMPKGESGTRARAKRERRGGKATCDDGQVTEPGEVSVWASGVRTIDKNTTRERLRACSSCSCLSEKQVLTAV